MMENLHANAAAGMLETIFPTSAERICAAGGERYVMGEAAIDKHRIGRIVRCPRCKIVRDPRRRDQGLLLARHAQHARLQLARQ
jgi:hypothetical protein